MNAQKFELAANSKKHKPGSFFYFVIDCNATRRFVKVRVYTL